jgi:hypothetical protein
MSIHPPHKYCPKCEQWRDLDGIQCGRCETTLVLRRLDDPEPALRHDTEQRKSQKTAYLGFRLSQELKQAIENAAQEAKEDISEYVLKAVQWRMHPPEPAPKHDGKLDEHGWLVAAHDEIYAIYGPMQGVYINDNTSPNGIGLMPAQALSLLAWLTQEKGKLELLAKEQEG